MPAGRAVLRPRSPLAPVVTGHGRRLPGHEQHHARAGRHAEHPHVTSSQVQPDERPPGVERFALGVTTHPVVPPDHPPGRTSPHQGGEQRARVVLGNLAQRGPLRVGGLCRGGSSRAPRLDYVTCVQYTHSVLLLRAFLSPSRSINILPHYTLCTHCVMLVCFIQTLALVHSGLTHSMLVRGRRRMS